MAKQRRKLKRPMANVKDTVKVFAFAQIVLLFSAGAIPEPFRLLALLPTALLMGAGAFWLTALGLGYAERYSHKVATAAPGAAAAAPAPARPRRIVKIA